MTICRHVAWCKAVRQQAIAILLVSLLLSMLPSCGFHLRGDYKLPEQMKLTYVQAANRNSELIRHLKRTLRSSGVQLVDSQQQATAVLHISHEKTGRRVLSVDAQGRAREYELAYSVSFRVSSETDFAVGEQTLQLERDFLFDAEDVLAKSSEESLLVRDMQVDMVRMMMRKLSENEQ